MRRPRHRPARRWTTWSRGVASEGASLGKGAWLEGGSAPLRKEARRVELASRDRVELALEARGEGGLDELAEVRHEHGGEELAALEGAQRPGAQLDVAAVLQHL